MHADHGVVAVESNHENGEFSHEHGGDSSHEDHDHDHQAEPGRFVHPTLTESSSVAALMLFFEASGAPFRSGYTPRTPILS